MAYSGDERLPSALLFTRGDSSVHMEVTERADGLHLTVRGPGIAVASYDFPDGEALLAFTREQERRLLSDGFQLQAVAERRAGEDRDSASRRAGPDRRRTR